MEAAFYAAVIAQSKAALYQKINSLIGDSLKSQMLQEIFFAGRQLQRFIRLFLKHWRGRLRQLGLRKLCDLSREVITLRTGPGSVAPENALLHSPATLQLMRINSVGVVNP